MAKPRITAVSPTVAAPAGGTVLTLTGTDLNDLGAVYIGDTYEYASLVHVSPTQATVVAPPRSPGAPVPVSASGEPLASATVAMGSFASATSMSWDINMHEAADPTFDGRSQFMVVLKMAGSPGYSPVTLYASFQTRTPQTFGSTGGPYRSFSVYGVGPMQSCPIAVTGTAPSGYLPSGAPAGGQINNSTGKSLDTFVSYDWTPEHSYRVTVEKGATFTESTGGVYWNFTVTDLTTGVVASNIIQFGLAATQGNISNTAPEIRVIASAIPPSGAAAALPYSAATYRQFTANASVPATAYTPGTVNAPYALSSPDDGGLLIATAVAYSIPTVTYSEYGGPAPTVTDATPDHASSTGGTSVTITGTNFVDVTAVRFDAIPAASFTVDSATQITAITPNVGLGGDTADIIVVTADGGPSYVTIPFSFDGSPPATDLATIDCIITQPTSDPTGGALHKVVASFTTGTAFPLAAADGNVKLSVTVPSALLASSGAAALSWRYRTITDAVAGLWSASSNIGTSRVASRTLPAWDPSQTHEFELSFLATTTEGSYDIAATAEYVVEV